jgi:hypothetical protein
MHNYYQGSKPFNEWYQKWYTHASHAGVDEQTKMFAFRRNLNQALHNKLLTLSPQPATLVGLVEKAREFDRLWHLYTSNAFTQRRQGARVRATNTEEESPRIGYSGTSQSSQSQTPHGPLSKEERKRRFDNKLCLYCGRAGHIARDCWQKSTASQGRNPELHCRKFGWWPQTPKKKKNQASMASRYQVCASAASAPLPCITTPE